MVRRPLAILALLSLLTQAALGGLLGSGAERIGFCLGGHAAQADATPASIDAHHHCSHDCGFPTPIPIDDGNGRDGDGQRDDCACTDVELASLDDPGTPRETRLAIESVELDDFPHTPTVHAEQTIAAPAWHGPPPRANDEPRCAHRLALVRSTRRLV